ncbi:MAG: DUF4827 domain-containing protein [Staphylococcus sp.]|nr:DUF4827 domain-containing protein [Staphylococcus sp.]
MKKILYPIFAILGLALTLTSCEDSKSYAERLQDENQAVNKYLVNYRVVDHIPADSVFEVGENAPYYCIDDDANVYMQVIDAGDKEKPEKNDRVYFRYTRYNLFYYVVGGDNSELGVGNADNMSSSSTFFLFDNTTVEESTQYGTGIQLPMRFVGYNAKVNLIVKSQAGASSEIAYVVPYLYTLQYFKPQI